MKFFLTILILLQVVTINAQRQNARSKSELGIFCGGSYYIGDINPYEHFNNTNLSYGGIFRYNINSRIALRANLTYGNLDGNDAESSSPVLINRNLNFKTDFYEFASGIEFNYMSYQTGHKKYKFSPYIFVEFGVFKMNPKANYNGDWIELQPLGTEGQGTDLSNKPYYSKTQICMPIGVGLKLSLAKNLGLNLEYGLRKTFTDYIDDIRSDRYVDRAELAEINGPLVAELSNRSLDGSLYGKRGNNSTNDWYFCFNATLTYRLGPPDRCFNH